MSVDVRDIIVSPNTIGGATVSVDVGGGTSVYARMDGATARELAAKLVECVEESERIAANGGLS
jgi:hypothetical protein